MRALAPCLLAAAALCAVALAAPDQQAAPEPAPLTVGVAAPDFTLKDQDGKAHRLGKLRGKRVVLAFYPADMTPGCTLEARSFRDTMAEFRKRRVPVFGVSVQDVASKKAFCDKEGLNYTLLADVGGKVAEQYGVKLPNGLARRITFVVDPKGRIAAVVEKVDVREHGRQVLDVLDKPVVPARAGS
ncbi:MAG: peroxiredoxin [Chthonomonadales bacterium]|nr:peroxiredoxin [Chthonomonadales bacterium]